MKPLQKITATETEKKHGWTDETLTAYIAEREKERSKLVFDKPVIRPSYANSNYHPHRWNR